MAPDAAAEEGRDGLLVAGGEGIEVGEQGDLVHRLGEVERGIEDRRRHVREQVVDGAHADRRQRPPDVVVGVRDVGHAQPSSATAA